MSAHNKKIKSLTSFAGTQTRGLTRFARYYSLRIFARYAGVIRRQPKLRLAL